MGTFIVERQQLASPSQYEAFLLAAQASHLEFKRECQRFAFGETAHMGDSNCGHATAYPIFQAGAKPGRPTAEQGGKLR
jgi:hypothetical protein